MTMTPFHHARILTFAVALVNSGCGLVFTHREKQPLRDPKIFKEISSDGKVILEDGSTNRIYGIRDLSPVVRTLEDIRMFCHIAGLRDTVDIELKTKNPQSDPAADIFVAAAFYRCGNDSSVFVPRNRYQRARLADLLLMSGLCKVDDAIHERDPDTHTLFKHYESEAQIGHYGLWGNTK